VTDGRKSRTVLVVDDDYETRQALRDLLEDAGYSVFAAPNGRVALQLLLCIPTPCVILADVMMPVMDGRELVAALDEHETFSTIPVTMMTAGSDVKASPGRALLRKPLDADKLLGIIAGFAA
jgi:two-component system, OmpR family, response regulator CpxR